MALGKKREVHYCKTMAGAGVGSKNGISDMHSKSQLPKQVLNYKLRLAVMGLRNAGTEE